MWLFSCLNAYMRTTVEIPDELFRRAKSRAAMEGRKLKELFADYISRGLDEGISTAPQTRRRSPLPVFDFPNHGPIPALSNDELNAILDDEDAERAARLAGR